MTDQIRPSGVDPRISIERIPQSDAVLGAKAYLYRATGAIQRALHPSEDVFVRAQMVFPRPGERRTDTVEVEEYTPAEEIIIRKAAAELGPGRATSQTIEDLGYRTVDAHLIEAGLLHKVASELVLAIDPDNPAPIIAIASDRSIPLMAKKENPEEPDKADVERLSTHRLLAIGGKELGNPDFYRRSGVFDQQPEPALDQLKNAPDTEYEAVKQFLLSMSEALEEDVYPVGYDPNTGEVIHSETGQLTYLGHYKDSPLFILRKDRTSDGTMPDTAPTMSMVARVAEAMLGRELGVVAYHTSATYKPSRTADALRCAISAEQHGVTLPKIIVPTYGYELLAEIRGVKPMPPALNQIVGELNKAAASAAELEAMLQG